MSEARAKHTERYTSTAQRGSNMKSYRVDLREGRIIVIEIKERNLDALLVASVVVSMLAVVLSL
jgi:hypothetical protein